MARKFLIAVLVFSLLLEAVLCIGGFFLPEQIFKLFGVPFNNDTAFPGYIISWFLLLVSLFCTAALWQVVKQKDYKIICYLLGFWWIAIGIGIYSAFKKPDNLFSDSLKGLFVVALTWLSSKKK